MARKKIGLFMNEINQFFQRSCGQAIVDHATSRDMDVIIYASHGSYSCPYGRNLLSEIGKKNIIHLPDYSRFDAIIVLPNSFDIYGMDTEFFELVKERATCPVICLQKDDPDNYSISIENKETMYKMTKHFTDVHGFTKICYMSGPLHSKDSPDRYEGFKQAMDEASLPIKENTVFEGNYWTNRGARAMDHFLGDEGEYPQAIICANDYMALSICEELRKRGKRVPEDVCVSGFDGIEEGKRNTPSLTTVTIDPRDYADAAFSIIDDIAEGKVPPKKITLSDEIELRASCGCGKQTSYDEETYNINKVIESEFLLREAGRITADYQNRYDVENALSVANYYFYTLGCDTGYICLSDMNDPNFRSIEETKIYSDEMILMQRMRSGERLKAEVFDTRFNKDDILPVEVFDKDHAGAYIIFPLYYKSKEYGFLVINPSKGQWPNSLTNTYTNALSGALENSYYQSQFVELARIKRLSETDPLTGLYNRRGFENGLAGILSSCNPGTTISIASIDMDDLKSINDLYGHADGDFALKMLADVLKGFIHEGELCARFGGDEFSAVLVSDRPGRIEEFVNAFAISLSEASRSSGKPYPIHASIGISDLKGGDNKHIFACMQQADKLMYMNKRKYKIRNK